MKLASVLLILFFTLSISAQSPGGVLGSVVWHKNISDQDHKEYGNDLFNFQQYKYFNKNSEAFQLPTKELSKVSMFIVYCNNSGANVAELSTGNGVVDLKDSTLTTTKDYSFRNTFSKPKFLTFIERQKRKQEQGVAKEFRFGGVENDFEGALAEVLIFDRLVSKKQRQRIESYFAIKYGISLPQGSIYYNSIGGEIWNFNEHGKFIYNNILLGRDDASALYQKQSKNIYSDFDLSISLGEFKVLNSANNTQLDNLQFMSVADNNEGAVFQPSERHPSMTKMDRIWKVNTISNSFVTNDMKIRIELDGLINRDLAKDVYLVYHTDESDLLDLDDEKLVIIEPKELDGQFEFSPNFELKDDESVFFTFIELPKEDFNPLSVSLDYDLFPNPILTRETFTFQVYNKENEFLECTITDKAGEVFHSGIMEVNEDGFYFSGELENEGAYFITVHNDLLRESFELIVVK